MAARVDSRRELIRERSLIHGGLGSKNHSPIVLAISVRIDPVGAGDFVCDSRSTPRGPVIHCL